MPKIEVPEQVKIDEIFFPYATKQRRAWLARHVAAHGDSGLPRLAHYTSAEAALSVIKTKRVWARNATRMIDSSEIHHGLELLHQCIHEGDRVARFTAALNACHADSAAAVFDFYNKTTGDIVGDTFFACLTEHDLEENLSGRLSMWRGFSRGAATDRVAIVLEVPKSSPAAIAMGMIFSPVAYLGRAEMAHVIEDVIRNVQENREWLQKLDINKFQYAAYAVLHFAGTCVKHPGFKEEREWRAVLPRYLRQEKVVERATVDLGGGDEAIYKIPLDSTVTEGLADLDFPQIFSQLIVGPATRDPEALVRQFVEELERAGVADAASRVVVSEIPLRPGMVEASR